MATALSTVPALDLARRTAPDRCPVRCYLARLAPGSRRAMGDSLAVVARLLVGGPVDPAAVPWPAVRRQHAAAVRAALVESGAAPRSVNRHLAAFRGVLREAWGLEYMGADELARACEAAAGVPVGGLPPAGRDVSEGELAAVLRDCEADRSPLGVRDAAVLALLARCGLRRAEAVALDVDDLDPESGRVTVRRGKGGRSRTVYARNGALSALLDWLAVRGPQAGPLLLPVLKSGRIVPRRMTPAALYSALERRAKRARSERFSPHDLRRTLVGDLLDAGEDLATVQRIAGHASPSTTSSYDRRPDRVKARAADRLHFAWVRKVGA